MTPGLATLTVHVIAILWSNNLSVDRGHTVVYPLTQFPSYEACVKALPAYTEVYGEQFKGRGEPVCVPK